MARPDCSDVVITQVKGVGPQLASKLNRLGIYTVQDLLFHLPFRYEDRTQRTPIGAAQPGQRLLVAGRIEQTGIAYGGRRSLTSRISDGTGWLNLRLFHFSRAQQNNLKRGHWVSCFGEIRSSRNTLEMVHPEYRVSPEEPSANAASTLTPVYPATEGVTQATLRRIVGNALGSHAPSLIELMPDELLAQTELPTLENAVAELHQPAAAADMEALNNGETPAQKRLSLEELLAHHLSFVQLRARRSRFQAPVLPRLASGESKLRGQFGFELTAAQQRVASAVLADLARPDPMLRLVQGDVGSGKTVVAAIAAARAADNGYQSVLLAPTELLAEQHFKTMSGWFDALGINVVFLSGRMTAKQRGLVLSQLASAEALVAIGTHALFQNDVEFNRLALVIVDEQHRFGVDQRLAMRDKGRKENVIPHQLNMTATPIPRTLAMTFYTDLDVSNIDELPPGRTAVETVVIPEERRDEVIQRIRLACSSGRQVYWVCPLIDESEALAVQNVVDIENLLQQSLPAAKIGLVHGRMKSAEKDKVMQAFRDGRLDVLVATTVIEVGVDVPNASLMIIENAERLGLSQLHQLRGRVGRGQQQSACVLLYKSPLNEHARSRLATLRKTADGFEIAQQDLELRGPGELLGTRQTGLQKMRVADLVRDRSLLPTVIKLGAQFMQCYPDRVPALIARWVKQGEQYGQV